MLIVVPESSRYMMKCIAVSMQVAQVLQLFDMIPTPHTPAGR